MATEASAIPIMYLNQEGYGGFCKLMTNIKSDLLLPEAFTQELTCWWTQSVYIWVLRAQSLFGLTLIEYSDLLDLLVDVTVHQGILWWKV